MLARTVIVTAPQRQWPSSWAVIVRTAAGRIGTPPSAPQTSGHHSRTTVPSRRSPVPTRKEIARGCRLSAGSFVSAVPFRRTRKRTCAIPGLMYSLPLLWRKMLPAGSVFREFELRLLQGDPFDREGLARQPSKPRHLADLAIVTRQAELETCPCRTTAIPRTRPGPQGRGSMVWRTFRNRCQSFRPIPLHC